MQNSIASHLPSLLKASWQGAVLILLVLAVQWVFGRTLHPRWRYGLWLLVMFRLALPWTIHSQASLFNLLSFPKASAAWTFRARPGHPASVTAPPAAGLQTIETDRQPSADQPATAAPGLELMVSWFLAIWLAGALALAIYILVMHYRLSRRITLQRPLIHAPVMNLLEDCKQQMGVRAPVTLVETAEVGSPSLFGFVRPRLLLPVGLTGSFSPEELRYVFLHELGHIKRHDILAGWLMTALQILHWFNPFVWLASHRMRVDRELACDALALSYGREEENQQYGDTIIKLLESFGRSAWAPSLAGAVENKNQLKERIGMIAKFKKTNRGLALAVALFAGLGLLTLTDAQSGPSQLGRDLIGTWILVGRPGEAGEAPAAGGRLKSITDTGWSITQADPETGVTIFHHGGSYTLRGNEYVEAVEYANENTRDLIGRTPKFTVKVEGDTFTQIGVGNPWKEVWKRVKSDSIKPHKSDSSTLQGTWRGTEVGGEAKGTASLVLQGSSLEFHGSDTNEWYKAAFSLYDTSPKQMVVVIKDCPSPEYVGSTSYAIYQIQDGTLTITGNEPGFPGVPANFDAPGVRKLVFKHP